MIRCRQCNSEFTEQARFCIVCGLPQNHQALELEKSIHNGAETLDKNSSNHCEHCGGEILDEARFCAVCGTAHTPKSSANQIADEASTSTQTPSLIRPIIPKSSSRSVIPSKPDSNGQAPSNPQPAQSSRAPENPILALPANISSPVNKLTQKETSFILLEPKTENRDRQQIAQQARQAIQNYSQTKDLLNPASFLATSKAAEQWRKSWRDRQYAEVGPAKTVSRGHASVPTPLASMQQSFLRMRAIHKNDKKQRGKRSVHPGIWITIFLMICLIIGLGAYLIISYFPSSPFGTPAVPSSNYMAQPTLVLVGTTTQTITIGRSIHLRGTQFGDNQSIILLRDTATPIIDSSGKNISIRTDSQGTFDTTIPVDNSWSVGSHSIEALDRSSNQNAFLTIQVIPTGTATTSSTDLSITMLGKPASRLNFMSVMGQENPAPQRITITNTSGSPLKWTAITETNNNLNWLMINDNNDYGQLAISQPHDMLISVNTTGLITTDNNHPYLGQIIFTINNTQLLTLPVQLQIVDATPEMVFSPNPIIAQIGPGNTCQANRPNVPLTLTLINLGTAAISWAVNPDLTDNIKFVSNGQLLESGTLLPSGSLLPSGQPGDTIVLTLQCTNIKRGQSYHVSVYANQLSWSESVVVVP